jgi:hypothetical protein
MTQTEKQVRKSPLLQWFCGEALQFAHDMRNEMHSKIAQQRRHSQFIAHPVGIRTIL